VGSHLDGYGLDELSLVERVAQLRQVDPFGKEHASLDGSDHLQHGQLALRIGLLETLGLLAPEASIL
jgi:hypothetical protein